MLTDGYVMNYVTIKLQHLKVSSYNLGIETLHIHWNVVWVSLVTPSFIIEIVGHGYILPNPFTLTINLLI
jgi:hypothetical protein